jgi:hypothetical protein
MSKHSGDNKPAPVREPTSFIPNTYQTPNDYSDRFLHLLTGEEWKVLSYAVRRTFGFGRYDNPTDRISVSQFCKGKRSRETGELLDHGTGLTRATVIKILTTLCEFRLLILVAPNDPRLDEGACYGLQLDPSKVDVAAMLSRDEKKREANTRRTSAARSQTPRHRANTHTPSPIPLSDSGMSDILPSVSPTYQQGASEAVCPTDRTQYVGHTAPGKSDIHTIPSGKPVENQNTHTPAAGDGPPTAKPVCVCRAPHSSEFCGSVRLAYARNKPDSINNPDGWAYSKRAVAGEFDDAIRAWVEQGKPVGKEPLRDTSACPDCAGKGFYYPEGPSKGVAKCSHPRLAATPKQVPARASP